MATNLFNPISGITPSQLSQPFTRGTAVNTTSGTAIDFTSIPSWVKRITLIFNGVSTNGVDIVQVQIGSGAFTTTGYDTRVFSWTGGTAGSAYTSGFATEYSGGGSATNSRIGHLIINNISGTTWVASGSVSQLSASGSMSFTDGSVALAGALDRVRITTINGTDTFDAGSVNIFYE